MRNLSGKFGLQSLYRTPTADRPLQPHEMTTEEFRQLPNVHYYGTYHGYVPDAHETRRQSAGLHLGTVEAAGKRLSDLLDYRSEEYERGQAHHSALIIPARVSAVSKHQFYNRPDDPTEDRGDNWQYYPPVHAAVKARFPGWADDDPERTSKIEYYENDHEDAGSTSVRVPDRDWLQTQGDALHEAIKAGKPVNPVHRALYESIGDEAFAVRPSSRIDSQLPMTKEFSKKWLDRSEAGGYLRGDLEEEHWQQMGTPHSDPKPLKSRRAA